MKDHLFLRQDVHDLKTAITFVYIIEEISIKQKMYSTSEHWHLEAKSTEQGSNKIHPWKCGKRTGVFIGMFRALVPKIEGDYPIKDIAEALAAVDPPVLEKSIATFRSKFREYKEDRHWVSELNSRDEVGGIHAIQIRKLSGLSTNKIIRILPAKPRQAHEEQALWTYYKAGRS